MKRHFQVVRLLLSALIFLQLISLSSCSETEVTPVTSEDEGQEITLKLSAPESFATRADSDHKLRFVAKLFEGEYKSSGSGVKFLERKEAIASDGNATIIFSVPVGEYTVLLFADYIPSSTNANASGLYADKYYDTSAQTEEIEMNAFVDRNTEEAIHFHCINNPNYDCFIGTTGLIYKTELKYEEDIVLKRAVSKVRFVSTTDAPGTVNSIQFKKFSYREGLMQLGGTSYLATTSRNLSLGSYSLSGMTDAQNKELFYFYTFASPSDSNLGEISFTVNYSNGEKYDVEVPASTIYCKQNYITTVKGAFLSPQTATKGDIVLHLSKSDDWDGNTESTYN